MHRRLPRISGGSRFPALAGQSQIQEAFAAGGFQVFRNALARGEERQGLAGPRGFVKDGPAGSGFVQPGEQQVARMENVERVHRAGEIRGFHGRREHQVGIDVGARGEKLRQRCLAVQFARAQSRSVEEDQFFPAAFLDRLGERTDGLQHLESDA